jgi:DNA-binding IclR family transcriptional regulator
MILGLVADRPQRISEIAESLGVHHSTALRLLHMLRKHGFVAEESNHSYRLGSTIMRLGFQAYNDLNLRAIVRPIMERLNHETRETIHLGVLEAGEVVYLDKVDTPHTVRMHSSIGAIAPLHCTGVAKAILAFLPEQRQRELIEGYELTRHTKNTRTTVEALETDLAASLARGYVLDDEEHEPEIRCIAAPIIGADDQVAGSFSISAPTSRVDSDQLLGLADPLLKATREASSLLGWRGED